MELTHQLSRAEKINRALDGRTQSSILKKMNQRGVYMTDGKFSRCKHSMAEFTPKELAVLSDILGTTITND